MFILWCYEPASQRRGMDLRKLHITNFYPRSIGHSLPQTVDYNYQHIAYTIQGLETSHDPAKDTCQEIGLFNGYGLGQTHTKQTCFSSHALAEALVEDWFRQKLQVMDLPTALCYWNLGLKINNCQYERNYYGITK